MLTSAQTAAERRAVLRRHADMMAPFLGLQTARFSRTALAST
jgi:hypothetical protein